MGAVIFFCRFLPFVLFGKGRPVLVGRLHGGEKSEHLLEGWQGAHDFSLIHTKAGQTGGFQEFFF
ncbi:hypothetical protein LJC14_07760, partial [Treponema sp. OttesenSCG-928-L16]|nr:hypothetical protein [Treponema sp. OttesenSCG-928-L16]